MDSLLSCLEIGASREDAELCVILMHGLGADAHDFEDIAQAFSRVAEPKKWRFVLPHASHIKVTVNQGMVMPAWYDILDMSQPREVDWKTVEDSLKAIEALMERESAAKLVLAGFSQGGAMALHVGLRNQDRVNGILSMSGYLLENAESHPCPDKTADFPIGVFHGKEDPVVPILAAEQTVEVLKGKGYAPEFTAYPGLEHSLLEEEVRDVFEWLKGI